jgi:hypothetical protein
MSRLQKPLNDRVLWSTGDLILWAELDLLLKDGLGNWQAQTFRNLRESILGPDS